MPWLRKLMHRNARGNSGTSNLSSSSQQNQAPSRHPQHRSPLGVLDDLLHGRGRDERTTPHDFDQPPGEPGACAQAAGPAAGTPSRTQSRKSDRTRASGLSGDGSKLGELCCVVRPVEPQDVAKVAQDFRDLLSAWTVSRLLQRAPLDEEQQAWNTRCEDAEAMSCGLGGRAGSQVYAAMLGTSPVGVLKLDAGSTGQWPSVDLFATHPGSQGAGWRLMAEAVNESERRGHGGCLRIVPLSDATEAAYRAMGFVPEKESPSHMRLDPSRCPRQWRRGTAGWEPARDHL